MSNIIKLLVIGIILLAIAFVLLIPSTIFAQEGSRNMMEEYCLKNLQDDPQCANYTPKKIEQNKIEQNKTTNPIDDIIQFILQIFQGFNPEETMKDVTKVIPFDSIGNTFENTIDDISNSIPIDMGSISGNSKAKLEDCSKYKKGIRDGTDMEEAFVALQKTKECEAYNINTVKQVSSQGTVLTQNTNGIFLKHEYCHKVQTTKCQPNERQEITTDYRWVSSPDYSLEARNISKISLGHIGVIEKDNYNLIILDIRIEPFPTGNGAQAWPTSANISYHIFQMGLKNENGRIYTHSPVPCNTSFGPYISIPNSGATITHCYQVEKNLDKFDVIYDGLSKNSKAKQNFVGTFLLN